MPYRSTERTRRKKDAKRTAMMQAAVRVFADRGYHAATIRDIVAAANVAVGTFYFYFPDKETLFGYLYEETGEFLLQTLQQAFTGRLTLPKQIAAGVQAFVNIAVFEPAVIYLLLGGGIGAFEALKEKQDQFREGLINAWQRPIDQALDKGLIADQNTRRSAEALAGGINEVVLSLLDQPDPEKEATATIENLTQFVLRALAYSGN